MLLGNIITKKRRKTFKINNVKHNVSNIMYLSFISEQKLTEYPILIECEIMSQMFLPLRIL